MLQWCAFGPQTRAETSRKAEELYAAVVSTCLPPAEAEVLSCVDVPDCAKDHCNDKTGDAAHCVHITKSMRRLQDVSKQPLRTRFVSIATELLGDIHDCGALRAWWGHWSHSMSFCADAHSRCESWPDDPLQTEAARTGKRGLGYIDADVKAAALAETRQKRLKPCTH